MLLPGSSMACFGESFPSLGCVLSWTIETAVETLARAGIPEDGRPWFCLTLGLGPPSKCLLCVDVHAITFPHLCVQVSLSPLPLECLLGCLVAAVLSLSRAQLPALY